MSSSREEQVTASSDERNAPGPYPDEPSADDQFPRLSSDLSSLSRAVKARRAEYIRLRTIRIKVGTWNVAALPGTERDIGKWFVEGRGLPRQLSSLSLQKEEHQDQGQRPEGRRADSKQGSDEEIDHEDIGIYVLGLQEIVDVASASENLRPYVDPGPSKRWKEAVQAALPAGYELIAESQLVGLLLLVYAAPNVAPTISSVSSAMVGTGFMGFGGNKGGVVTRIVLGETTRLVFVNCHLAAGADKTTLERRNADAAQIVNRTRFGPIDVEDEIYSEPSDSIGQEEFAFWFGDLNYRLDDIPGDDVRRLLTLHTQNEYDLSHKSRKPIQNDPPSPVLAAEDALGQSSVGGIAMVDNVDPHSDPAAVQTTLSSLLPHDQLRIQQRNKNAFHEGWREGKIRFLPTYKYDVGSVAMFDSSEKQRGPSWCDRILYRSKQDRLNYEKQVKEAEEARKRDEEMKARGLDKAADDDSVLFDYDPDIDGAHDADEYNENDDASRHSGSSEGRADQDDSITLTHYTSHQGILSSDHKPLVAEFILKYNAVIPDLKAKVHQEVARELDKAENEARPGLTVVIDHYRDEAGEAGRSDIAHDPNAVYFGGIPFDVPIPRNLTIANTGRVPATFCFSTRPIVDDQPVHPWLDIQVDWPADKGREKKSNDPDMYTLAPGESATVQVTVWVKDIEHVRLLNAGKSKIEDILVLKISRGRDHFVPIYGKWLASCFGRSLAELTRIPESGVRSLALVPLSENPRKEETIRLSAPRELFRLTEAISDLAERAVAEWSMTKGESDGERPPWASEPHGAGWPFSPETWTLRDRTERASLLSSVREALDTGTPLNSVFQPEVSALHRLEILSETLISFLRSLEDGVVRADVWKEMEHQLAAREKSKNPWRSPEDIQAWVLDTLASSPVHSVSFTFLTFMLNEIINETAPSSRPPARPSPPARGSSPSTPTTTTAESRPSSSTDFPPSSSAGISSPSSSSFSSSRLGGGHSRTFGSSSTSSSTTEPPPTPNNSDFPSRRHLVEATLASIFSDVMISSTVPAPTRDKDRRVWEERKMMIVQAFLQPSTTNNNSSNRGDDEGGQA
jgi:phosphatidylinositol-bisphosphatase